MVYPYVCAEAYKASRIHRSIKTQCHIAEKIASEENYPPPHGPGMIVFKKYAYR